MKRHDSDLPRGALAAGIAFVVLGLVIPIARLSFLDDARASHEWATTSGVVSGAQVVAERHTTDRSAAARSGQSALGAPKTRATYYRPEVTYSYRVQGRSFTGRRVSLASHVRERAQAEQVVAAYTKGQTVTVYYDSVAPEQAVLVPGLPGSEQTSGIYWGLAGLLVALGAGFIFAAFHFRPSKMIARRK